jgi:BarA-like signal transduction histidine kinase
MWRSSPAYSEREWGISVNPTTDFNRNMQTILAETPGKVLLRPSHHVLPRREYQDMLHYLPEKKAEVLLVHGEEVRRATG